MANHFVTDDFPLTTLPLEEAVRKFVPPELWQAYEQSVVSRATVPRRNVTYSEYIHGPEAIAANRRAAQSRTTNVIRKQAWQNIVRHLRSQLQAGELTAYVREVFPFGPVRPIPPDAWRSLTIADLRSGRVKGHGTDLTGVRIDRDPPLPRKPATTQLPAQLAAATAAAPSFSASADFGIVQFGELQFQFGIFQALIVRQLHEASLTGEPWQPGKVLLHEAGANTRSIGDLFRRQTEPHWRRLIDYRHNGQYRLLPHSGTVADPKPGLES